MRRTSCNTSSLVVSFKHLLHQEGFAGLCCQNVFFCFVFVLFSPQLQKRKKKRKFNTVNTNIKVVCNFKCLSQNENIQMETKKKDVAGRSEQII